MTTDIRAGDVPPPLSTPPLNTSKGRPPGRDKIHTVFKCLLHDICRCYRNSIHTSTLKRAEYFYFFVFVLKKIEVSPARLVVLKLGSKLSSAVVFFFTAVVCDSYWLVWKQIAWESRDACLERQQLQLRPFQKMRFLIAQLSTLYFGVIEVMKVLWVVMIRNGLLPSQIVCYIIIVWTWQWR